MALSTSNVGKRTNATEASTTSVNSIQIAEVTRITSTPVLIGVIAMSSLVASTSVLAWLSSSPVEFSWWYANGTHWYCSTTLRRRVAPTLALVIVANRRRVMMPMALTSPTADDRRHRRDHGAAIDVAVLEARQDHLVGHPPDHVRASATVASA